jgi:hypothetical protein
MIWDDLFTDGDEMKKGQEESRMLPNGMELRWWPSASCGKYGSLGVITVRDLSLPNPPREDPFAADFIGYDRPSVAQFCTYCRTVGVGPSYRYHPDHYLPILRKRVLSLPSRELPSGEEPCPLCHDPTCAFYNYWEDAERWETSVWTVCRNPACDWPGKDSGSRGSFGY